jgi:hypothetical protein
MKVKTFTCPIKIFKAKGELDELDKMVNKFIDENNVKKVVSVSEEDCTLYELSFSLYGKRLDLSFNRELCWSIGVIARPGAMQV